MKQPPHVNPSKQQHSTTSTSFNLYKQPPQKKTYYKSNGIYKNNLIKKIKII